MIPFSVALAHAAAGAAQRVAGVLKARDPYFDNLSAEISGAIIAAQGNIFAQHVQDLLASLELGPEGFSRAVAILCNGFRDELGPAVTDDVLDRVLLAYTRGTVDMIGTTRWELNLADERAIGWLNRDVPYWIGEYWSPELAREISQTLVPAFSEGLEARVLAERMREVLGNRFTRSDAYWRGFATNAVTRARNFGVTEGAVRAGFRVGRVSAILDETTSDFCRAADGRQVLVQDMVRQRDEIVASQNPEQIRTIAPWPRSEDVPRIMDTADALGSLPGQYAMPPYHFHCRTVIVFE